jgi:SAM-dependent methyltransferase
VPTRSPTASRPSWATAGGEYGARRTFTGSLLATMTPVPDESPPSAITPDYDRDPDRFRLARSVLRRHALAPDVHERVARRFVDERVTPVLDVGCGEGELARHLPAGAWVGVDTSAEMLARAPETHHLAHATALPFPDERFGSVALLYVLYHLPEPAAALAEAHRVLRHGGLVAVAAPSRDDSPELADALPPARLTFDAELAPELLAELFAAVEVERWDAPLVELPTQAAVRDYLIGKGVQPRVAESKAESVTVPLSVTKRGALAFGRKL